MDFQLNFQSPLTYSQWVKELFSIEFDPRNYIQYGNSPLDYLYSWISYWLHYVNLYTHKFHIEDPRIHRKVITTDNTDDASRWYP